MCLISFLSHFVSLIDADAANNAALFTLKGGFNIFKDLMIYKLLYFDLLHLYHVLLVFELLVSLQIN